MESNDNFMDDKVLVFSSNGYWWTITKVFDVDAIWELIDRIKGECYVYSFEWQGKEYHRKNSKQLELF